MPKRSDTFLTREDVEKALINSLVMSSFHQQVTVLHKDLEAAIVYNKEIERQSDVANWIKKEKTERKEEKRKAKEWNRTHKDIDDVWIISPPPHAMTYRGVTICGWCLGRKEDKLPKGGCSFHYWKVKQ